MTNPAHTTAPLSFDLKTQFEGFEAGDTILVSSDVLVVFGDRDDQSTWRLALLNLSGRIEEEVVGVVTGRYRRLSLASEASEPLSGCLTKGAAQGAKPASPHHSRSVHPGQLLAAAS